MVAALSIAFLVLLLAGEPIALVMGGSTLVYLLVKGDLSYTLLPQTLFQGLDSFPLMAVPFFILAGALMNEGGMSPRLVRFAQLLVGHIRGGLGLVTVVSSMLFAGVTGSAAADASAIGSILIPAMRERGYRQGFATAVTAAASTLGPIIPPSIPMILYGVMTNVSIGALFLAGALPGVLFALGMMALVMVIASYEGYPTEPRATLREVVAGFRDALLALAMPGIILGGILAGVFTATESAAIAAVYAFVVGYFVYGELKLSRLPKVLLEAGIGTAAVMFIIGLASSFGWVLAAERIPQTLTEAILDLTKERWLILLLINLLMLFIGTFLETAPALTIMVPVLAPLAQSLDIDPVQFGAIVVLNLVIGLITPPSGASLFITCTIGKISLEKLSRALWPYLLLSFLILALVTYLPAVTLWLPRLLMGG